MPEYAQTLTYLFAVCTVLLQLVVFVLVVSKLALKQWLPPRALAAVAERALSVVATVAVGGVMLSLWYSEVVGLPVCPLCWFARTMMYPLAVLLVVAAVRKDALVWHYTIPLSVIGMCITGYHHLYQVGVIAGTFCTALKDGADCAQRYVYEFDYVTMPLMGFTLFATVALLSWIARERA